VDADEKGPYMLHSKVEKSIKEGRDKKATGDGDALKLLGEYGVRIMTQLINNI
jgi:hypothetical protein